MLEKKLKMAKEASTSQGTQVAGKIAEHRAAFKRTLQIEVEVVTCTMTQLGLSGGASSRKFLWRKERR